VGLNRLFPPECKCSEIQQKEAKKGSGGRGAQQSLEEKGKGLGKSFGTLVGGNDK